MQTFLMSSLTAGVDVSTVTEKLAASPPTRLKSLTIIFSCLFKE